jgi:methylated-DNA-[protein]-cysteine S-methyltransferase
MRLARHGNDMVTEFGTRPAGGGRDAASALFRRELARTPFGPATIFWRFVGGRARVVRVALPAAVSGRGGGGGATRRSCPAIEKAAAGIMAALQGRDARFAADIADLSDCTPFQRTVLRALRKVPRGSVVTYGRLAATIGRPRAARAVGRALAANPVPLIVPCHRVIRADGQSGGFRQGTALKRALLAAEAAGGTRPRKARPLPSALASLRRRA